MRHADIQEVGMENFGPYLDPMILEFKNDSMVLMTGPNGIGKTMALDAIPYTFYGSTSKGMKGDDVVNNTVGRNCKTWVKFKIDDDQYIVTRYQKYTKLGNTVILNKNKVDIKKGHKEVLPEIEKLLCSKRAFMNTLMFGQKVKNFFTDLIDSDKKLIFRELLALELYQAYYKETDTRLKNVISDLAEIETKVGINAGLTEDVAMQIQIFKNAQHVFEKEKQAAIVDLKKSIDSNRNLLTGWEADLAKLQEEDVDIESTLTELTSVESEIKSIETDLGRELEAIEQRKMTKLLELQNKANDAQNTIRLKFRTKYDAIKSEKDEYKTDLQELVTECQSRRHKEELKIQEFDSDMKHWLERAEEIQINVLNAGIAECPTCEQEVSAATVKMLEAKVATYRTNIDDASKATADCETRTIEINAEMKLGSDELKRCIDALDQEHDQATDTEKLGLQKIDERLINANGKVEQLVAAEKSQKISELAENKKLLDEKMLGLMSKRKEQEVVLQKIQTIESTTSSIESDMKQRSFELEKKEAEEYDKTQINSYLKRQIDLESELQTLNESSEALERRRGVLEFWKTGFSSSGIPSMLIDEAIPFMNEKVAEYLDMFTNGRYIVSFDTMASTKAGEFRDKISVNVIDTHTRANSRIQLSGGQTRIIDIATILTLGDLQESIQELSINILLFDEIFDSLDDENIGFVSKVLSNMKVGKSIYLISHRHEDQLEADEVLSLR